MILSIISIIANAVFLVVLNMSIYTDRTLFPDGSVREWQRSPVARLALSDETYIFYIQIAISAICIISSILVMCGVKNKVVKIFQIVSLIASVIMFVAIMILTDNMHAKYA